MKSVIYKVTNLTNGKIYVGKTIQQLSRRKTDHINCARLKKYNMVFHKAIDKYGKENFVWEIIESVLLPEMLSELEKYYIKKYNCMVPNGYNLTAGGEGLLGFKHSEESKEKNRLSHVGKNCGEKNSFYGKKHTIKTREKMSRSGIGRKHPPMSEETKDKIRLSHSGEKHCLYGKHLPESTKRKMSAAHSGEKNHFWGKHHSEEARGKMKDNHANFSGKNHPMWGKRQSEETRAKMKLAQSRRREREAKIINILVRGK